jgi:hypothetical protein
MNSQSLQRVEEEMLNKGIVTDERQKNGIKEIPQSCVRYAKSKQKCFLKIQ